jgi:hypothetical protein
MFDYRGSKEELRQFTSNLRINKHDLDTELEQQSQILFDIAEKLATSNSRRDQAKEDLTVKESELAETIQSEDPKLGVAKVNVRVNAHPSRTAAWRDYVAAKKDAELWAALHEAWKARGYALKSLCDLQLANYYTTNSHSPKTENYDRNRNTIAQSRGERGGDKPLIRRRTLD